MKKLLFFATIILSGLSVVNAQKSKSIGGFNQGDIFATGAISFGSSETGDMKESQFEFNPSAGLFISDNIAIGVALGLETRKNKRGSLPELKTKAFAVGAFGQYYFTPQDQFSFLLQLSALYTTSKAEQAGSEVKGDGFVVGFAPGISYFISRCIVLQANVGLLSYSTFKFDEASDSTNTFALGLDLSDINFGLTYKF